MGKPTVAVVGRPFDAVEEGDGDLAPADLTQGVQPES